MAATQNGHSNGLNGHASPEPEFEPEQFVRFAHIPRAMDIPVSSGDIEEAVEVDLEDLMDDPTELCTLLENENVAKSYWMTIALAYAKQDKVDHAVDIVTKGLASLQRGGKPEDKLALMSCLCWLYLLQCRDAPRVKSEKQLTSEVRVKDYYLRQVTATLNDASRISPTYHPLLLARGVVQLVRASLQQRPHERQDMLTQAAKYFGDAFRFSGEKNVMAMIGQARALYSLGKFSDALGKYQDALRAAPLLTDPDPRIGIGCCFWQLGHRHEAQTAWKRSLELNNNSKMANILLGLYHLDQSAKFPTNHPEFQQHYKRAMTEYTQTAWKKDPKFPLTCATFANYFLLRKAWPTVEKLARQAIEATDVNAIAGDGWYLLARKEHYEGDIAKATDYYTRADQARGGDDKGYLPAKFGAAQLRALARDYEGAKHRLERIVQHAKSVEAMTLLGLLYAEDVYANQANGSKEDKSAEMKKAIALLEQVRNSWKDPKKKITPDSAILLNLARLYESDSPERSLQCLQQVEKMEIEEIPEEDHPQDIQDEALKTAALRELLPPQLLNNMAAFHFQAERYTQALELFQSALNACVKIGDKDTSIDTDALVTSISFNLARTYEAEGMNTEATKVYQGLLERHPDYTDARLRLAYLQIVDGPSDQSAQPLKKLLEADPGDLEIRALYGWHIHQTKKRTMNPAEDQEQRHYKHSLQDNDKHDRYSLTGMGNIFLQVAREMRRDTDQDKEKRSKTYARAIEFFDKALQLDPKNAYAAQGIGIALAEEKKDHATAIQIFTSIREALRDASVFLNLGHSFCEVKQYARAIENYEQALAKTRGPSDPAILACLGRVWLLKGKQEKDLKAMKSSLEYSLRAAEAAPEQVHFRFNIAFVQLQIASLVYSMVDSARTLVDVETAAQGLDEAIETLMDIAKGPNPPFPRNDIEQRANMGKNTMRKQLERALTSQRDYENKNAERLEQARSQRDAEIKKREDQKRAMAEAADQKRRLVKQERERIAEQDRAIIEDKIAEEQRRKEREAADMTTDVSSPTVLCHFAHTTNINQDETGEKKKREKRKKGPKGRRTKEDDDLIDDRDDEGFDSDSASDGDAGKKKRKPTRRSTTPGDDGEEGEPRKTKRRKLERKSKVVKENNKFKSSEMVVDSDSDDAGVQEANQNSALASKVNEDAVEEENAELDAQLENMSDDEEAVATQSRRKKRAVVDEDEEEDDEAPAAVNEDVPMVDDTAPAAGNETSAGQ